MVLEEVEETLDDKDIGIDIYKVNEIDELLGYNANIISTDKLTYTSTKNGTVIGKITYDSILNKHDYEPDLKSLPGNILFEVSTGNTYIWRDNDWIEIDAPDNKKEETIHHIVVSDCPKCASNLPISETSSKGICKCKYCGKEVYVWAKGE